MVTVHDTAVYNFTDDWVLFSVQMSLFLQFPSNTKPLSLSLCGERRLLSKLFPTGNPSSTVNWTGTPAWAQRMWRNPLIHRSKKRSGRNGRICGVVKRKSKTSRLTGSHLIPKSSLYLLPVCKVTMTRTRLYRCIFTEQILKEIEKSNFPAPFVRKVLAMVLIWWRMSGFTREKDRTGAMYVGSDLSQLVH